MQRRLEAEQIFALAEQMERQGAEFYSRAFEAVDDPSTAAVLRGLMQQELEHEQTFGDLCSACRKDIHRDLASPVRVPAYLESMVSGRQFLTSRKPAGRWRGNESLAEVVETALEFEKDAIAFFVGLRPIAADARARAQIDRIIEEELQHVAQLSGLLSSCSFDLGAALKGLDSGSCLILTHDNPDPDALAAAQGMHDLLASETDLDLTIGFGGTIGRAENRELAELLGIPPEPLHPANLERFDCIVLVDSQPGAGNTMVPDGCFVNVVVDHHPRRKWSPESPWTDVRQAAGSTASIVYTYLLERRVAISMELATALLYGIISDTMDLGRGATPLEYGAYVDLLPRCDLAVLGRIRRPELPCSHFRFLHRALGQVLIYADRFASVALRRIPFPDFPSEIADLLLRGRGVDCSFCSGCYEDGLRISFRTAPGRADAGALLIRALKGNGSAGGHEHMAGGYIPLGAGADPSAMGRTLSDDLARLLGIRAVPVPLVASGLSRKSGPPSLPLR